MRRFIATALFGLSALSLTATAAVTPLDHVAVIVDDNAVLESDIDKRMNDVRFQFAQRRAALRCRRKTCCASR